MVFQSYALYPHMSVRNNLSFGLENLRKKRAEIDQRVDDAARMLQIEALLTRKPGQLSGGQRQRVAIGRAVVREPRIFLFDEPLSNLDAELRVTMRSEISDLHRRLGNTMIYVTHDQVEAMTMADKIAVLRGGVLEQFGAPLDVYNHPANMFVAGFIGSPRMNFFDGEITACSGTKRVVTLLDGAQIALDAQMYSGEEGQAVVLGIRANHLSIAPTTEGALCMRVKTVEQLGGETYLYGEGPGGGAMTLHLDGQAKRSAGAVIALAITRGEPHLFDKATEVSLAAHS
jgi:multiple sugar transport system ATP-binding protein